MKRNGDVRLAAVTPGAMAQLQHAGIDRLFEIFSTNDLALNSFRQLSMNPASQLGVAHEKRLASNDQA